MNNFEQHNRLRTSLRRTRCASVVNYRLLPASHLQFAVRISDNRMSLSTLGRPAPYDPASRRVSSSRRASTPAVCRVVQCHPRVVIPIHDPFDWRSGKIRKIRKPGPGAFSPGAFSRPIALNRRIVNQPCLGCMPMTARRREKRSRWFLTPGQFELWKLFAQSNNLHGV